MVAVNLIFLALTAYVQALPSLPKLTTYLQDFTEPGSLNNSGALGFGFPIDLTSPQKGLYYTAFSAGAASAQGNGIGIGNGIAAHSPQTGIQDAAFGPDLTSQNYLKPSPGPGSISINYKNSTAISFEFASFYFGCAQYNATHKYPRLPEQRLLDPTNCTLTVKGYRSTSERLPGPAVKPDVTATFNYKPIDLYYVDNQQVPARTNESSVIADMHKAVLPFTFSGLKTVTFQSGKLKNVFVDDLKYTLLTK